MIWRTAQGGGLVWCEPDDQPFFQKASISPCTGILFNLFFKSSWCKIAGAARNWINSVPKAAATTFAFSSVPIYLSSMVTLCCTVDIPPLQPQFCVNCEGWLMTGVVWSLWCMYLISLMIWLAFCSASNISAASFLLGTGIVTDS